MLQLIMDTYAQFFNGEMWIEIFTNPVNWALIGTLVVMEGLLSADNAIALAVQVKHLPEKQRKKALMYGLWGAYFFRFVAIGIGTALVQLWWIKLIGGLYLLWMAVKFFWDQYQHRKNMANSDDEEQEFKPKTGWLTRYIGIFWATVVSVEMMDIAFSVDSVLAAFGISDMVGILLLGGMLGILMMRGVAQIFTKLMEKVPELEFTAYLLIATIGIKMLLTIVDIHVSNPVFLAFVVALIAGTFVWNKMKSKKH